jgi:signal transduction histidine kinase
MRAVDDLDVSIRQVRSTIFELNQRWSATESMRGEILAICEESAKALGFRPACDLAGPIDNAVVEPTRGHLLLCLREALSNVARHARAGRASVAVEVHAGRVTLTVADDGIGCAPTTERPSSGLDNMLVRAESLGGWFSIDAPAAGGTVVIWDVPLQ